MAQEADLDAQIAASEAYAQRLVANVDASGGGVSDNDNIEVTDADLNDPDLLAELGDLGYESDEAPNQNEAKSNDNDSKVDSFEEIKATTIQLIIKKRGAIQSKMKQFQQAMDAPNASKCQQCDRALLSLQNQIKKLEAIEFATDKDDYDAKINKIMDNFGPLSSMKPTIPQAAPSSNNANKPAANTSRAAAQAAAAAAASEEEASGAQATIKLLQERAQQYKLAAKKCLNAQNKPQAMQYLRQSKEILSYAEPVQNGIVIWMDDLPPRLERDAYMIKPSKSPNAAQQQQQQQQQQLRQQQAQQAQQKAQPQQNQIQLSDILDNADEPATPQMIRMRMDNYRIAAVNSKKQGNLDMARKYFAEFKTMKEQLGHVEAGKLKITVGDLPRSVNTGGAVVSRRDVLGGGGSNRSKSPNSRAGASASTAGGAGGQRKPVPKGAPPAVAGLSEADVAEYGRIIQRLQQQMKACDSDSAFLAHDPAQAAELMNWKKESHIWLTKTLQCQKMQLKPPKYEMVKITFSVLKLNSDIKENELRVVLKRFKNIQLKGTVQVFAQFAATRDDKQLFEIKGKTKTVQGKFDCEFGYVKGFKIIRDHNLDKKIKYGRFEINMYQPKKQLFGTNNVLVGSATIKLKQLLENANLEEDVTLKDPNSGAKIGELELEIKLRSRVEKIDKRASKNKKEMVPAAQDKETVNRQLMKITEFPQARSAAPQQAQGKAAQAQQRKNSKGQAAQKPAQGQRVSQTKRQSGSASAQAQVKPATKKVSNLPPGVTEEMVENPLDPTWIESFEVMEKEQQLLQQQLAGAKGPAKEEIQDKLDTIALNLSLIQTQVATGLLTIEQYTAKIQNCLQRDFALRKHLISLGRNEEAKRVGMRVVWMKKEMKGDQ